MNQETGADLPWKKTIKLPADEPFQMAQLTAQGTTGSGTVKVAIKVNGKIVKTASANGYGVAMADAEIGDLG